MIRQMVTTAVAVVALTAQACESDRGSGADQSSPQTISDGVRVISKGMRGFWSSPGGPKCRWWITAPDKVDGKYPVVSGSPDRYAKGSQTMLIASSHVGGNVHSDACGGWSK